MPYAAPSSRQHRATSTRCLAGLPPLPAGFALQFHSDDRSYGFSMKDTRDACHCAIFSDQDKLIYDGEPRPEGSGRIVPLATKQEKGAATEVTAPCP